MDIIKKELRKVAGAERVKNLQKYFRTGIGQYGEGDVFIGVSVPELRRIARKHWDRILLGDVEKLFMSEIHEERLVGILILVEKFASQEDREEIYNFYLKNLKGVNNWDLVDLSAPKIVGEFLLDGNRSVLDELASSENLWERRIAIVSTFAFIRVGEFDDALRIGKVLLKDKHDLIHKAVGWMLREVGKRDEEVLKKFLRENYSDLPRITLRYAIERFGEEERKKWMRGDYLIFL
ncbi:MAG: DNA alkylation repair protein [archaeon]